MEEEEILDSSIKAGIEPNTHFLQEVEIIYKPIRHILGTIRLRSSEDAYTHAKELFDSFISHHEEAWVLLLNSALEIIGVSQVAKGGITETVVDVRIIYQMALMAHATGIILVHNHPGGMCTPSMQDERLTEKMAKAGKMLEIKFLDHLIVTWEGFYSFSDNGKL